MVVSPEFFRSFHAGIDLLDRRLDVAARQRQALLAIFGVVHAAFVVGVMDPRRNKLPSSAVQILSTKSEIRNKFKARMSKNSQTSRVFDI